MLVGALILALVSVAAVVVDIGVQRVARSDMQSVADVVALDLARELDGRRDDVIDDVLQTNANLSRDRNNTSLGATPVVRPELGTLDKQGVFTPTTDQEVPNAVRVTAETTVSFTFGLLRSGGTARTAVAAANPGACIKIGSSVLDLNSGQSTLLGPILEDALNISAISYTGLLDTQVGLGDLALALGAGSTGELLDTQVSVGRFYAAVASAVSNDSDTGNDGVADVFKTSVLQAIDAAAGLQPVRVADLVSLDESDNAALTSKVNVVDLVTAAAFVANGQNSLAIPSLTLPAGISASLYLTDAPRLACRNGTAETAQVKLVLSQSVNVLGALGFSVASIDVRVTLDLGKARGGVGQVGCRDGEAESVQVRLDQSSVADLTAALDVKLLGFPVTTALLPSTVPGAGEAGTYTLDLPRYYSEAYKTPIGAGTLGIPDVSRAQLTALGIDLGGIGRLIVGAVNPALSVLTTLINTSIAPLLGLRLGGADLMAVPTAQCLNPALTK